MLINLNLPNSTDLRQLVKLDSGNLLIMYISELNFVHSKFTCFTVYKTVYSIEFLNIYIIYFISSLKLLFTFCLFVSTVETDYHILCLSRDIKPDNILLDEEGE